MSFFPKKMRVDIGGQKKGKKAFIQQKHAPAVEGVRKQIAAIAKSKARDVPSPKPNLKAKRADLCTSA